VAVESKHSRIVLKSRRISADIGSVKSKLILAIVILAGLPAAAERLPVLTRNQQIQQLSVQEAGKAYPVKITGIVTFISRVGELFVQDESAGVFVFALNSHSNATLTAGDRVQVRGVTTAADFSPSITNAEIQYLGTGSMPEPLRIPMDPLIAGRQDARWVEVGGVARSGQIKGDLLFLSMAAPAGATFLMITDRFPADWASTLVDARITARGVLAAIFNERRQSIAFRVFVPDLSYVHIDSPAARDPFSLPLVSTLSVGQFHPMADPDRRIRVRGTLLAVESPGHLFLADRNGSLQIEGDSTCASQPGVSMDAVGFPAAIDGRPGLQNAICRNAGHALEASASPVTAVQVIPPQVHSDPTGYGISAGTRYDLKPISIEGTLLQSSPGVDGQIWSLEDRGQTFVALLPRSQATSAQAEVGGRFRLNGICVLNFDHYHRAQFFRVLVRNPGDVVLIARPPWRSFRMAALTVCGLFVMCLIAVTWGSALRKQVHRQTRELRDANGTLKRLSSLDFLTGTGNRRHFDEVLAAEVGGLRHSGKSLSLLMIDIDYFKAVNDLLGHQKGDAYLEQIAHALKSVARRASDLVCRYGGEEFAVILPGTDRDDARTLAEEIRQTVLALAIPHPTSPSRAMTVSIGVSAIASGDDLNAGNLIAAADRALYRAKRLGRNQVTCGDSTEPTTEYGISALPCSA
jgi:diguanylate cyclase (GGDEF)-like protein